MVENTISGLADFEGSKYTRTSENNYNQLNRQN